MSRKKPKINLLHKIRDYCLSDLAKVIGLSTYTVYKHIKEGLPVDKGVRPYQIRGADAIEFYQKKYHKKSKPKKGDIRCFSCGEIFSLNRFIEDTVFTGYYYRENLLQIQHKGHCPNCSKKFSRFDSHPKTEEIVKGAHIHIVKATEGDKNV